MGYIDPSLLRVGDSELLLGVAQEVPYHVFLKRYPGTYHILNPSRFLEDVPFSTKPYLVNLNFQNFSMFICSQSSQLFQVLFFFYIL